MTRLLVLVRHGKAEGRAPGVEDSVRELTEAGWRALRASLDRSLSLLDAYDELSIWSSPAVRALQTAQVVAMKVGCDTIYKRASLYGDDINLFLGEFCQATGNIIAVGHNPFMERLFAVLAGTEQHLGKGAVAAFSFEEDGNGEPVDPKLIWFAQAPQTSRWGTLVKLEQGMAESARKVSSSMWSLLDNPEDPETLHAFRVSLRTTRSLLSFIQPYLKRKQQRRVARDLRRLQARTSRLRELDILAGTLEAASYDQVGGSELLALCLSARDEERAQLLDDLQQLPMQRDFHKTIRSLNALEWRGSVRAQGLDSEVLRRRFELLRADYTARLAHLDLGDVEEGHEVRKYAKLMRYVASSFDKVLGEEYATVLSEAKEMQDQLGELCDVRVNMDLIARLSEVSDSPDVHEEAAALIAEANERELVLVERFCEAYGAMDAAGSDGEEGPRSSSSGSEEPASQGDVSDERGASDEQGAREGSAAQHERSIQSEQSAQDVQDARDEQVKEVVEAVQDAVAESADPVDPVDAPGVVDSSDGKLIALSFEDEGGR